MTDTDYEKSIARLCYEAFDAQGLKSAIRNPDDENPFETVIVEFTDIGDYGLTVVFEHSVLPIQAPDGQLPDRPDRLYILQTFVGLLKDIDPSSHAELAKAISRVNLKLPLGAFGLTRDGTIFYLKYNSLFRGTTPPEQIAAALDLDVALLLHQLYMFTDGFIAVVEGHKTAEDAFLDTPLGRE